MKILKKISYALVIIGSLNWGLVGLFDFNLVNYLLGASPTAERLVYLLVGISALLVLVAKCKDCRCTTCK